MSYYKNSSPWFTTPKQDIYLDLLSIRPVASSSSDIQYTIQSQYAYRPDLLAYDLYGDSNLWWVFIQRNMDVIQDPILDFIPGTSIYLPKKSLLLKALGI